MVKRKRTGEGRTDERIHLRMEAGQLLLTVRWGSPVPSANDVNCREVPWDGEAGNPQEVERRTEEFLEAA